MCHAVHRVDVHADAVPDGAGLFGRADLNTDDAADSRCACSDRQREDTMSGPDAEPASEATLATLINDPWQEPQMKTRFQLSTAL